MPPSSLSSQRIIFMGTPEFAVPALKSLIEAGLSVKAVYTQPPRPSGRGYNLKKSPVHLVAEAYQIPVMTPSSLKSLEAQREFSSFNPTLAIVAAYGLLLPQKILEIPPLGCVNIHASLLPRWRGASPIHRALQAGDLETGITFMLMDEGLDTGSILAQKAIPITSQTTTPMLHDQLAALGAEALVPTLEAWILGGIIPIPQPQEGVVYAPKLSREEGILEPSKPAHDLERQIRAFIPWPGSFLKIRDLTVKVLRAHVLEEPVSETPGFLKITKTTLLLATTKHWLSLDELQPPGKNPLDSKDYINGYLLPYDQKVS